MTLLPRTIVIVGAGFSGTAVAINLLRLSYWKPVRVVLLERAERGCLVANSLKGSRKLESRISVAAEV